MKTAIIILLLCNISCNSPVRNIAVAYKVSYSFFDNTWDLNYSLTKPLMVADSSIRKDWFQENEIEHEIKWVHDRLKKYFSKKPKIVNRKYEERFLEIGQKKLSLNISNVFLYLESEESEEILWLLVAHKTGKIVDVGFLNDEKLERRVGQTYFEQN
ncbi:MAG: hypothetical protein R2825_12930 [Saprospiraceae bacterium]